MKLEQLNPAAQYIFSALEGYFNPGVGVNLLNHCKLLRDTLDEFEGHKLETYTTGGKYNHETLKHQASMMSEAAAVNHKLFKKGKFVNLTHREHAKPIVMIVKEGQGLKGQDLLTYLHKNLLSVTIMKQEQKNLDKVYKTTMPDSSDILSRFSAVNIKVVKM
jgi:hypothetical protein